MGETAPPPLQVVVHLEHPSVHAEPSALFVLRVVSQTLPEDSYRYPNSEQAPKCSVHWNEDISVL